MYIAGHTVWMRARRGCRPRGRETENIRNFHTIAIIIFPYKPRLHHAFLSRTTLPFGSTPANLQPFEINSSASSEFATH